MGERRSVQAAVRSKAGGASAGCVQGAQGDFSSCFRRLPEYRINLKRNNRRSSGHTCPTPCGVRPHLQRTILVNQMVMASIKSRVSLAQMLCPESLASSTRAWGNRCAILISNKWHMKSVSLGNSPVKATGGVCMQCLCSTYTGWASACSTVLIIPRLKGMGWDGTGS